MDFSLSDEQQAIADLAGRILEEQEDRERAWSELAKADLLGLCLPEDVGGGGYGFVEACLLLEQAGHSVAHVPLLPTLVTAMTIAEWGTPPQRQRWLPGVATGEVILTADPDGGRAQVPYADLAAAVVLVSDDNVRLAEAGDLTCTRQTSTSGEPQFIVEDLGAGERIGGSQAATWIRQRWTVALCALQVGVCESALKMTADYVAGRHQFERPIGSFQAVGQRLADAYIDVEAMRLTMWQAAWRLAEGITSDEEVAIAKFWASDGGQRVCATAQHLHGGIGVALDYPLHRHTLMAKQVELTLGSGTPQLVALGEML
jgi:alkylation response protein AidB-like acyl-CoA dehydrogenase